MRYCRRIPSIFASLSHGFYSRSRARVALGRELQLPMSFPWPIFPGLDQDLFPPMVFLVFWDSIPKRCKGVHYVDLGESFPTSTSIYLQNLVSIQPRTSQPASRERALQSSGADPDARRPTVRSGSRSWTSRACVGARRTRCAGSSSSAARTSEALA